ncbi:Prolyl tripeptidyl peptidase precursor [Planctomycetes bacterium Poly30]|uniref:Prolyl tripeptidyl peptidase n=1 Tax=Saltatorellus ferox TaxID=2528018 RepID=A0A518EMR6_9BACT|nr:Prolyl tripeptidyl peptidase precursor [Planctomycetes bacterium Poly30]
MDIFTAAALWAASSCLSPLPSDPGDPQTRASVGIGNAGPESSPESSPEPSSEASQPTAETRALKFEEVAGKPGVDQIRFSAEMPSWDWGGEDRSALARREGRDKATLFDPASGKELPDQKAAAPGDSDAPSELALTIEDEISRAFGTRYSDKAVAKIAKALAMKAEQTSRDGKARLVYLDDELWVRLEGHAPTVVARGADGEIRYDRLSPNGLWVSWVREGDLFLADTATGRVRAITSNGGPDQFNGVLDWVYQEEIYGRGDFQAHFWSPSGEHTAFISLDESPVYEFTVVDHIEDGHFRVKAEVTNYPKVGDPNPIPEVGIVNAEEGAIAWVDLSRYDGQEILIVRVGWTPDGARCLVHVQDRIQTWADVLSVDPETGKGDVLIRETSDTWTERPEDPTWLGDGSFLWQSHRTGTNHIYRYAADGTLMNAVTSGEGNVLGVEHVEEPTDSSPGHVWFASTAAGDINRNVYRASLDGASTVRLTHGEGTHSVSFNGDRTMFVDSYSSLQNPGRAVLCDADGKEIRELSRATIDHADEFALGTWELFKVKTRDGVELDVSLLKPADFDPAKSYAISVATYSGPAAPSVRNRWNSSAYYQFLAQQGILTMQANVRTSTLRGQKATSALYRRVGLQEVDDMSDVVDWLTANPWADGDRVMISGFSFGGTMTANCLMRTDKFRLGFAGGGVYDWRMYDTIYTERYMRTPVDNLEGYEKTSVLAQAKNLDPKSHLHLFHGIMDDNVHVQNLYQMVEALMKADKTNWSMMAYPQTRHGIRSRDMSWHAKQTEWRLIQEHLLHR